MASVLRVVLQEDVKNLGVGGEVVKVRPGYARNFLLPRGLAMPATAGNLARVEEIKALAARRASEAKAAATAQAAAISAASIKIQRAMGEGDKMYGSVTTRDIEEAYAAKGITVDRRKIELADPIRALGTFEVPVKLSEGVVATLKLEVVKKA